MKRILWRTLFLSLLLASLFAGPALARTEAADIRWLEQGNAFFQVEEKPQKSDGKPDLPSSRDEATPQSQPNAELPIAPMAEPEIRTDAPDEGQPRYKNIRGVVLYDGRIIEGQIIQMNAETVNIRTRDGKTLSFSFLEEVKNFLKVQEPNP